MNYKMSVSIILTAAFSLSAMSNGEKSSSIVEVTVLSPAGDGGEPRSGPNELSLQIIDPNTCYKSGDQICVRLNMANLSQPVTGFQAFLSYDPVLLTYQPLQSCYSKNSPAGPITANCPETGPFPSHIQSIATSEVPVPGSGDINLDGSILFPGGLPTSSDALLATLCFTVKPGNDGAVTSFVFRPIAQFSSELSFQGTPLPTTLVPSVDFGIDQTPPTITCPADPLPDCLSEVPPVASDRAEFVSQGGVVDDTPAYCGGSLSVTVNLLSSSTTGDCQTGPVTISRTYRATDVAGNVADCTEIITVAQDNTPPDIDEVPPSLFLECDDEIPAPYADLAEAIAGGLEVSDTCNMTLSLFQTLDESACPRLIVRFYRVYDECNNFSGFKHVIVVDDNTAPDFSGSNTSDTVDLNCEATAELDITVHDNCGLTPAQVNAPIFGYSGLAVFGTPDVVETQIDHETILVHIEVPVSNLAGCPAVVSASVSATDTCGNPSTSTTYTATITDDIPPVINGLTVVGGAVDGLCERLVTFSATVDDNCCVNPDDVNVQVNGSGPATFDGSPTISKDQNGQNQVVISGSILVSELTGCPASVEVIINAMDCCANPATQSQDSDDVVDNEDPSLTCPSDQNLFADAGTCTASGVVVGTPTVDDNCDDSVAVDSVRQGGGLLTDPYPVGVTTISWTATDDCGNESNCDQTITVASTNLVLATLQLPGVNLGVGSVQRCIRFIPRNGANCGDAVDITVTFTGSPAVGTVTGSELQIDCGVWTSICAKDEQHTLSDSSPLTTSGIGPVIYSATNVLVLRGGDTDNDNDVDINDVTLFLSQFGDLSNPNSPVCPWDGTPDSNFSLNGAVLSEDYQFLSDNWQQVANCCTGGGWPLLSGASNSPIVEMAELTVDSIVARIPAISVDVASLAPGLGESADLNTDGVIDVKDVELFESNWGLDGKLSRAMREAVRESDRMKSGSMKP